MKNTLCLIFCILYLLISCQKANINTLDSSAQEVKNTTISNTTLSGEQCLITTDHITKCDDNKALLKEKIVKVETETFHFIASPVEFKNQVLVGKPRPLSADVSDFEGFKNKLDKTHLEKIENSKIAYFLKQDQSELIFSSYKFLDLKIGKTYTFSAVLYKITTSDQIKKIIFIEDYQ